MTNHLVCVRLTGLLAVTVLTMVACGKPSQERSDAGTLPPDERSEFSRMLGAVDARFLTSPPALHSPGASKDTYEAFTALRSEVQGFAQNAPVKLTHSSINLESPIQSVIDKSPYIERQADFQRISSLVVAWQRAPIDPWLDVAWKNPSEIMWLLDAINGIHADVLGWSLGQKGLEKWLRMSPMGAAIR